MAGRTVRGGLLAMGLLLALLSFACRGQPERTPADPRLEKILQDSWRYYRQHFITPEGRVRRPENGDDTISEGQAYTLLRAVWCGDQATFDKVYAWTLTHLSKERLNGSHLLAWHWGRDDQGQWRLLDRNSATDADLDFALALLLAARRWGAPTLPLPAYHDQGRAVLADILTHETSRDPWGRLWLLPGDWASRQLPLLVNPSYFSPAWYRLFARITGESRWQELEDSAFWGLQHLSARLGEQAGVGLPPDWARLTAEQFFAAAPQQSHHFGWDAVRIPWRLALAVLWWQDQRARRWLQDNFLPFCRRQLLAFGRLTATYDYLGQPAVPYESPVLYASLVAAARAGEDPDLGRQALDRLLSFYRLTPEGGYFNRADDYYANNWAWFGLAAAQGWLQP